MIKGDISIIYSFSLSSLFYPISYPILLFFSIFFSPMDPLEHLFFQPWH